MDAGSLLGQAPTNPSMSLITPPKPDRNRKRLRLEKKPPATPDIAQLRQQISDHKRKCQEEIKDVYRDNLAELYFLQSGANLIDFPIWRKKPNIHLSNYLKYYSVDPRDLESINKPDNETQSIKSEVKSAATTKMHTEMSSITQKQTGSQSLSTPSTEMSSSKREHRDSLVEVTIDSSTTPSEATMVEQAKKEAQVLQRVAELRKQGLWSLKRLPKVQEPSRSKAHWDYLVEEMQWLAADFAQERRWKKAGCRKISRMILRYHQERADDEKKAEKEELGKLKRIAGQIAKQVKDFWSNIEKVVQYKHDSRLDEKRRQAMDMHLNFIVDQTEKYSSWLSEGLTGTGAGTPTSVDTSAPGSLSSKSRQDDEFQPLSGSSDDEETIAREEEQSASIDNETDKEIAALQAESEMPLDELLASLPAEVLEKPASIHSSSGDNSDEYHSAREDDSEFEGETYEAMDDEQTLVEQEQHEEQDYNDELKDLKDEGDLTVEELALKYAGAYASDFELPDTPSSSEPEDDADDQEELSSDEESGAASDGGNSEAGSEDVGMEYLLHPDKDESELLCDKHDNTGPKREITDIAAAAQSLQPTGYTLETTVVKTPIPFLLKHTLREYQHVGLDWLATMYDRKLNGILADEMGLGKTIQTIALLAHLACEHSIWGPHLIVVPTSVMLNWEMELKKWCPGFKILTYYGTPKERKIKRTGWTKTNAFHVCITSYKLVIQDHQAFKRKKWKYLVLDEAQNIKNFKSQRWQTLLNFSSQRRLLLTGTPLQNNLMELWSLMHFLMPNVFQSHMDFKEWFANPVTGMIEGTSEYNEQLIRRLHKVLRPFLLRRLKADVERQLPKKYEHVVMCKLSKRQRYLYEEFMSRRATKETLSTGNFMSVINILMQLRKVCNHPDMFDPRPIISPYETLPLSLETPADVVKMLDYHPLEDIDLNSVTRNVCNRELELSLYASHRARELQTPARLIQTINSRPDPPARPPPTKLRPFVIRSPATSPKPVLPASSSTKTSSAAVSITSTVMRPTSVPLDSRIKPATTIKQETGLPIQLSSLVSSNSVHSAIAANKAVTTSTPSSQPITLQIHQTPQGTRLMIPSSQLSQLQAGFVHIIQTSTGQHLITSAANAQSLTNSLSTSTTSNKIVPISSVSLATGGSSASQCGSVTSASVDPVTGRPSIRTAPQVSTLSVVTNPAVTQSTPVRVTTTASTTPVAVVTRSVTNGIASSTTSGSIAKPTASAVSRPKSTSVLLGPASRKRAIASETRRKFEDELKMRRLDDALLSWKTSQLYRIATTNKRNCSQRPIYGTDLHHVLNVWRRGLHKITDTFAANSTVHCHNAVQCEDQGHPYFYWNSTSHLKSLILSPTERLAQLKDILERYVFVTPAVKSSHPKLHVRCSQHSNLVSYDELVSYVSRKPLIDNAALLHPIQTRMLVQFPEKRLIQYDCGKLQTLDILLRRLKLGEHRVLIFTQMTRMLDVLEAFLNYHGHRYLRLDGTTKVEMRQSLMDRFNADKKIFVFILSTRSGGIGVNLTGADTVIFYDSDWNPTMDAQAQDRCHRIGQTRDVHIYRLVSEMTVEENILKKANQKRLLGDVAIEGGNFTTAKLQQNTISDLFAEPSGLHSLIEEKQRADVQAYDQDESTSAVAAPSIAPNLNEKQFEQALCEAEDDEDVKAAAVASEEAGAELAEFDENIPWDEREAEMRQQEKSSKVELEIALLEKELTPVERYAVQFLEDTDEQFSQEAVQKAKLDIEEAKRDWELNRLKEQRQEEERLAELEEDDMLYTYTKEDGMNQAFKDMVTGENMPMWCPPTPPRLENDVYSDQSICFLYDSAVMSESQLPAVYIKKEKKRAKESHHQSNHVPKKKARLSEDQPQQTPTLSSRPPRSLFDRPTAALLKLRRDKTMLRHAGLPQALMKVGPGGLTKPLPSDSGHQDQPEWLIHEDWSLLQAVQVLLQLPLNLTVLSPAHIPNWDLVSDIVSTTSRIYRSPKQCRLRYENVIIPREEGKLTYEANPRKQQSKKIPKSVMYKTKGNKPMKTGQLYTQDSGSSVTTLHAFRFDCIKNVASKRTPTLRPTLVNSSNRNSQHTSVVGESGINYDSPLNPEEVAKIRQERIRQEKSKQVVEQQRANQTARAASIASQNVQHLTPAAAIISPINKSTLQAGGVSIARTLPGSIVVNTPGNASFSAINKRLTTQSTSVISGVTQVTQLSAGSRKMTVQEMQQLAARGNTIMQRVQGTTSGTAGAPRTITVQQQALAKSFAHTQLNILKQQQAQRAAAAAGGTTLVAQRATASATSQLLSGQQTVMASGVPTLVKTVNSPVTGSGTVTLPVSGPVNINVSLAQQKALTAQQGKTTLTPNQQFRQIQLLHTGNKPRPLTAQQKIGLTQHQLVGKTQGGSVQIVQQKIGGGVQQKLGIQQIQHLMKQSAAAQQAQIITTPTGATVSGGQTIIATTQLITPANMHATITKMATPTTNPVTGGVSNVTVSLSRNLVASSASSVAIVPSSATASLVQSPSKVLATAGPRQQATAIAHRISGVATSTPTGTPTSVVNLASVSLQNQSSVSASIINKGLTVGGVQTLQQVAATPGTTILHTRMPTTTIASTATVLQQTIISNSKSVSSTQSTSTATTTVTLVPPTQSPAVVQIASTTPVITVDSSTPASVPVATNTITLPVTPIISVSSTAVIASTPTTSTPTVAANVDLQTTSAESSNESIGATPDPTRTYAMRPRKTN